MTTNTEALREQFEKYVNQEGDIKLHRLVDGGYAGHGLNQRWRDFQAGHAAGVAAERERCAQVCDFARAVMQAWPEGGIDGGHLQEIALAHGLLRPAEPPPDWDGCNFYERTELIK